MADPLGAAGRGFEQGFAWGGGPVFLPVSLSTGSAGALMGGLASLFGGGGGKSKKASADDQSVARTSYIEQLMGLAGQPHAHHLARIQIDAYNAAQNAYKQGWGPNPGDITTWLTNRGVVPQQGQALDANNPLNPVTRDAFLARTFMPFQQQQAAQLQSQLGGLGQQMQQAIGQYGKNLPPGYANMYNLNNQQLIDAAKLQASAGFGMANAMNNPLAASAAQQLQAYTAAANKAYMEQRTALSNALSTSAGGGLGGIVAGSAAAGAVPTAGNVALPQVATVTQPKTP